MYGEDEWKMSGYKTKYSTDEKQLYISDINNLWDRSQQADRILGPSPYRGTVNNVITIYITDVKQLYIPRKFEIFCEHDRREGSLRFENFRGM